MTTSGTILRIEVENFKSYFGKQIIGPFKNFSCVVGPNGSGKSNLMDAISFVMGLRAQYLRSANLKQLIYNADNKASERDAYVKLVYLTSDGTEIHFMRTISSQGTSEYKINDVTTSASDYQDKLQSFGILTKARNFLVFQGDVEQIAQKSPLALTKLFEQVSGSDKFEKDYEKAKEEKDAAAQMVLNHVQMKRGIGQEKQGLKEQKKEAEKLEELNRQHKELQIEYTLWKLYYIEKSIKKGLTEKRKLEAELDKLKKRQKTVESQLRDKKKEQAGIRKDHMVLAKKMKDISKKLEGKRAREAAVTTKIQVIQNNIDVNKRNLKAMEKSAKRHEEEIKTLEKRVQDAQREAKEAEENLKKEREKELKLSDDQMKEYNTLKNKAGAQTITQTQELDKLKMERQSLEEQRRALNTKIRQMKERKTELAKAIDSYEVRLEKLRGVIEATERALNAKKAEKNTFEKQVEERQKKKKRIEDDLEDVRRQLQEAKAEKTESERQIRFAQALDSMKRLFPGVYGKLIDLCKITRDKYNVAVRVAMGSSANAIIVDDEKTAIDCIKFLKEQRTGTATFLPLRTLKVKKINEKLRTLGEDYKLAIDVIAFDEKFTNAFTYSLGNTLVCKDYEGAAAVCFKPGAEKIKAVTLDGTVIHKSGLISGGLATIEKVSKFDPEKVLSLKSKRDKLVLALQEIVRDESVHSYTESKFDTEIGELTNRLKYTKVDFDFTENKRKSAETEIKDAIDKQLEKLEPELKELEKQIKEKDEKIESLEKEILKIETEIFKEFSKAVGVSNIREFEEKHLKALQELQKSIAERKLMISRLENKLEFEKKRDVQGPLNKLKETQKKYEEELEELKKKQKQIEDEIKTERKEYKDLEKQAKEINQKLEDKNSEITELKKIMDETLREIQKVSKSLTAKENEIEQLRNQRQDTYRKCKLEEVELPIIEEEEEEEPKKKKKKTEEKTPVRRRKPRRRKSPSEMETEEEEEVIQSSETFGVSQEVETGEGKREREEQVTLDFSSLNPVTLNLSPEEYDKADKQYRQELDELVKEIEVLAPSLKSVDKYNVVKKKYDHTVDNLAKAKEASKEANKKFNEIKQKRASTFKQAFEKISKAIGDIYKELTKSKEAPNGGTAVLTLEDPEEPYLGGVRYSAMPPKKRYREMEQLSGGEKTVAALALLFAIQKFRPSPFFILDEIDAALDNANVAKVVRYVNEKKKETQFIVISLKESFFTHADSLIGIYKDRILKSSKILTLDLLQLDKDSKQREEEEELL